MYKKQIEVLEQIKNLEVVNEYKVQSVIQDNTDYKQISNLYRPTGWGGSKFLQVYHELGFFAAGDTASTYINTNNNLYSIEVKRQKDLTDTQRRLNALGFLNIDEIVTSYYSKTQDEIKQEIDDLIKQLKQDL